ncbi:hypothetical protein BRD00_04745 [Halobacteriales archaeon QS_8_69_26]|nr:MAG: hypothetical protein BRD00_04745 [Halobacteriales archaeon QS_8_69_26]
MIEWVVTESGVRVHDAEDSSVRVDARDLSVSAPGSEVPRPVDETLDLVATELRLPIAVVYVESLADEERYELANETEPLDLPDGEYLVDVDAEVKTYLKLSGPVTVRKTADFDEVVVTVPERRAVTVGFRSRHREPAGTVTVPPTPEGMATALSRLHSSHKTTGPDRSYPTLRGHPPLVELGDELDVPKSVAASTRDTGVELLAPADLESLYVLAPLAYYLQASVSVAEGATPTLRAPAGGVEQELDAMPVLERDATRVLRKVFFLDCLVRNAGPFGTNLAEASLLDTLELDAEWLYDADPAERLSTYLSVPYEAVEHRLPDWHLSTYVEPVTDHLETLPYLLDDLSLVYTPRTSELEGSELVERSLGDFYRSGAGQVASVDIVKPELRGSRVHGWLAEGTPIDVFKSTPAAYRNRAQYRGREGGTTRVTVVLNDEEMYGEHVDVAEIYRDRGEDIPVEVTVHEHLSTAELAEVFEAENDFVHYIGHCEEDGLRCPNGYLPASNLSDCNTQTFFLNACGSYYEGIELVEKGAVAGAITFSQVLDEHAVKVGTAFARLLIHGFAIERAMQLARRRIMMGKDYAVVGDGTHVVTQNENRLPATTTLEEVAEDSYLLTYDQFSAGNTGGFYHPYVEGNEYSYLCGNESEFALDRTEVREFLRRAETPVVYDGDVCWSNELEDRFDG